MVWNIEREDLGDNGYIILSFKFLKVWRRSMTLVGDEGEGI